jgi:hypothetical protein
MQPDTAATRYGLKLYKFTQSAKSIALANPDQYGDTPLRATARLNNMLTRDSIHEYWYIGFSIIPG